MEAGRDFQFLEVIGTNVLAKEVVRHFSNLTAKECWESAKRVLRAKFGIVVEFDAQLKGKNRKIKTFPFSGHKYASNLEKK